MIGTAQILRADARSLPLADDSVDLCVSSPPYWSLRSYQDNGCHYTGQIGAEATPGEFVDSLIEVTRELVRVTKPGGSIWINLGDKYNAYNGNRGQGTIQRNEIRQSPEAGNGLDVKNVRPKSLIGIPWRYALRCIDDLGLILRAEVIWSKPNGLPESVTDRVRRSHEQWFHFTLSPRYFSAVDEIREAADPVNAAHHARYQGRYGRRDEAQPTGKGHASNFEFNPLGKLPGSVWTVPTEPLRVPDHLGVDHFAAFPTEFPKRIIAGWSPAGVCVECGEGRRPITIGERVNGKHGPVEGAAFQSSGRFETATGHRNDFRTIREITGYACACTPCDHDSHYMTEDDGHSHWRCLQCGQVTECGCTCPSRWNAETVVSPDCPECHGRALCAASTSPRLPPTRPAVVLDPFGGTGTTAMVAKALGRHGISVDMSADYCRLAEWRTNDRDQLAKVLGVAKADPVHADEASLLDLLGEDIA